MKKVPVVFDIDGTLTAEHYTDTNLLSLRGNPAMLLVAIAFQVERPLIISTARPERLREQTNSWLMSQGLKPSLVLMKSEEDEMVPDHLVKYDHLNTIRSEFGDPLVWVDDNESNVEMLRGRGVPVIHAKP